MGLIRREIVMCGTTSIVRSGNIVFFENKNMGLFAP